MMEVRGVTKCPVSALELLTIPSKRGQNKGPSTQDKLTFDTLLISSHWPEENILKITLFIRKHERKVEMLGLSFRATKCDFFNRPRNKEVSL